jgi:glutaredoxin
MSSKFQKTSNPSQAAIPSTVPAESFPGQGTLGSFLLLAGAGIGMLACIDRTAGLPFEMPRTWYSSPMLWYFFAFGSFLSGVMLLRSSPVNDRRWQPEVPGRRFERILIYTREECHLCDQAKDALVAHRTWLPEIQEVDITSDTKLMEQFSEQIPVVEIDGQIRFRGQVNEILLRRLIDATPPKKNG